ncbi:MAG: hypothetical protein J5740_06170 [Bacteroidales bacterium]|nr:hypothetical protein [Bacteroidales bacterium]
MSKLQFRPGFQHICQLSADKGIIFYSVADILVYYSIFGVRCIKEDIIAIAFSIMLNHVHFEGYFKIESRMVSLMHGINTSFAKTYNSNYSLQGPVFHHGFQHSQRYGEQKIRDTFIYIGNNGKVKTPGIHAEDYRWNLIKYLASQNPFSETIDYRTASPDLLFLLSEVLSRRRKLQPLDYACFGEEYQRLNEKERQQLIDFIICAYFFLDREKIMSLYGTYDNICTAMNAVSGSEHGFSDDLSKEDYRHYYKIMSICKRLGYDIPKLRSFSTLSLAESSKLSTKNALSFALEQNYDFKRLVSTLKVESGCTDYELAKFFHLLD